MGEMRREEERRKGRKTQEGGHLVSLEKGKKRTGFFSNVSGGGKRLRFNGTRSEGGGPSDGEDEG